MSVPGHRIGQAANLAHEFLMGSRDVSAMNQLQFVADWKERTKEYIDILTDMEKQFSNLDEDWTDRKPEKKPIPVKLDFGDGETIDITT